MLTIIIQGTHAHVQERAKEDTVMRVKEMWNLHDTIHEIIDRIRDWLKENDVESRSDAQTRGLVAMMKKEKRMLRRALEWQETWPKAKRVSEG